MHDGIDYVQPTRGAYDPDPAQVAKENQEKNIERLQGINMKLRNRIKDLNLIVERALEKQHVKFTAQAKQHAFNQPTLDPDHMLRIRTKEIENSRKAIEANNNHIMKMKDKLQSLGGFDSKGEPNWEMRFQEQLEIKKKYELQIKQLEKQNNNQGFQLEKAVNDESGETKLKSLNEELRIWKAKVAQLAVQVEKDQKTRTEQTAKVKSLEQENKKYQTEVDQADAQNAPKRK